MSGVFSKLFWGSLVDSETFLLARVVSLAEMGGSSSLVEWGKLRGLCSFILVYDLAVFFMIYYQLLYVILYHFIILLLSIISVFEAKRVGYAWIILV